MMDDNSDDEIPELVAVPGETGKKIPVTILTGFLGSGKTTLLRYLLTAQHGKRIAIIENEFSLGMGIEGMIAMSGVDGADMSSFFELNNGCICCTVKDNLLATLEQLVLHKDRFDYVLIETTGVANPGPVISVFWADEGLESTLRLDGVVCVVDCVNIENYLSSSDTRLDVSQQICYADRILLNKSDLIQDAAKLRNIEATVRSINGFADIKLTTFSAVEVNWVLEINSYYSRQLVELSNLCQPCDPSATPASLVPAGMSSIHIASTLVTKHFRFGGEIDKSKLALYLDNLLYGHSEELQGATTEATHTYSSNEPAAISSPTNHASKNSSSSSMGSVYRMKGLLRVHGSRNYFILQSVHDIFDIYESTYSIEDQSILLRTNGENVIVVIGRQIEEEEVYNQLLATRWE